jgi:hypothetical protein
MGLPCQRQASSFSAHRVAESGKAVVVHRCCVSVQAKTQPSRAPRPRCGMCNECLVHRPAHGSIGTCRVSLHAMRAGIRCCRTWLNTNTRHKPTPTRLWLWPGGPRDDGAILFNDSLYVTNPPASVHASAARAGLAVQCGSLDITTAPLTFRVFIAVLILGSLSVRKSLLARSRMNFIVLFRAKFFLECQTVRMHCHDALVRGTNSHTPWQDSTPTQRPIRGDTKLHGVLLRRI